ncbi:MAG: rhodanese-related sulfurtransferase [Alphaproteobacteria bacterium]|nr:rhodanese-related sulfurtransferase [Alphaproteobacteria bacterium]
MEYKVAALYKFMPIEDIAALRAKIYTFTDSNVPSICGTLLIAPEGINGTIAAHPDDMATMVKFMDETLGITEGTKACEFKYSYASKQPFNRFKVRKKKELITLRKPEANPSEKVGEYVEPKDWNALINDPEVLLLDTRNDYETKVGTFDGAVDPDTKIFTELPEWIEQNLDPNIHKKVAMYCTGGIRCEKASSYMLDKGFENVYHLKGGILQYLEEIPAEQSKWKGDCFVFDQRVSVGHGLEEGDWKVCHACREPLSADDAKRKEFEHGISCHHCIDTLTPEREHALRSRQKHYADRYGEAS